MEMEIPLELVDFLDVARRDSKAELECKLLSGRIQVKDVADRILSAIKTLSVGPATDTSLLRIMYPDDIRVEIEGSANIQKVCVQNSFKGIPIIVQRKSEYFKRMNEREKKDVIDIADYYTRFTLRFEEELRRDWDASPTDPRVRFIRLLSRKSFRTPDGLFQIDFSLVKSRRDKQHTLRDVLKESPTYELEIEYIKRDTETASADIAKALQRIITTILQSYQRTPFILGESEQSKYAEEFRHTGMIFYDIVTLERRHVKEDRLHNILKGYTVTNKADGERSGLYVARDRKLLRIDGRKGQITWTGIEALTDAHVGDFLDGEYIPERNLFCIFDIYRYKNRDTQKLPLMKTDDDTVKNPESSRLGCARLFKEDLSKEFVAQPGEPMRIETKLFLAGDGPAMEQAIRQMLDTTFEYEIDGLVFTPRASPVAPQDQRRGNTWLYVYKWKPPHQNSVDFLLKFVGEITFDPVLNSSVRKGELYVSRGSRDGIVYPCQTLTGEYVPKELPAELAALNERSDVRIPTLFQPSTPRNPDAYQIFVPVDGKNVPIDEDGNRVEDNTIIECSYDVEKMRWSVMRTRYDKTHRYRVLREAMYGNATMTAESVWTSIHIPVSEEMIRNLVSTPIDDTLEDETYYRTDDDRRSRVLRDVGNFHNRIKDGLYAQGTSHGDTLLELAVGRSGDLGKWKNARLSKVVGIDYADGNLNMACKRALEDRIKSPSDFRPYILYIKGDMTQPLYDQESEYYQILAGTKKASTKYLEQFEGLIKFDDMACQFAMHYACETEEIFREFVRNIDKHCKKTFFGTCSDGASVYSLLMGKKNHIFTNGIAVGAEYVKQYEDRETWTEEFGMAVKVSLETVETPQVEYLVPFAKITDIFREYGFELVETNLFSELYLRQTKIHLTPEQQAFSFLNRSFIFRRGEKVKEEKKVEEEKVVEEKLGDEEVPPPVKEKKTRKLRKGGEHEKVEPPVLFLGAGEDQGEFRAFSNDAEYPIEIDGTAYPTVEHYYQSMKAKEFADEESLKKIMDSRTPKVAKALGRKVKGFMKEVWDEKKREVMLRAVKAKFIQHPELQKQLLETGTRQIGKADPRNTFWGIGTGVSSEKSGDPTKWRGKNELGKMLMAYRQDFKDES